MALLTEDSRFIRCHAPVLLFNVLSLPERLHQHRFIQNRRAAESRLSPMFHAGKDT